MKTLLIEWRHLDRDGNTCLRCSDTGRALDRVVADLAAECAAGGWSIEYRETRLTARDIAQSNLILINGQPIEVLLPGARAADSECASCCEFTGQDSTRCRTVEFAGQSFESIPEALIRQAVCRVADCCEPRVSA